MASLSADSIARSRRATPPARHLPATGAALVAALALAA
jgi:hypothetical protein